MGIGQALSEGVLLTDDGRQRNPYLLDYKLQTAADVPPMTVDFVDAPVAERRSQGPQGHRRATVRPDARGDRERHRPSHRRRAVLELPMTPERVFDAIASASREA